MKISTIILIFVLSVISAFGQERYVKPVDEAAQDASFLAFRTKLIQAAEKRDVKHILSIIDPEIEVSFGGHKGIADFKTFWKIDDKNSKFWDEFSRVIKNGGRFEREGGKRRNFFTAPYTYSELPDDLDFHMHYMIFGSEVNLREKPELTAPVVSRLSYNVVKIDYENSTRTKTGDQEYDFEVDWYKVETFGGKKGFVKSEYVRSAIDYRAGFEKKGGQWKMIFFIAGD